MLITSSAQFVIVSNSVQLVWGSYPRNEMVSSKPRNKNDAKGASFNKLLFILFIATDQVALGRIPRTVRPVP